MEALEIDIERVEYLYESLGYIIGDSFDQTNNLLLEDDYNDQNRLGIFLHPAISINQMTYRGYLEGTDIFDAVCSAFETPPTECKDTFHKLDSLDGSTVAMRRGAGHFIGSKGDKNEGRSMAMVWAVFGLIILSQVGFLIWYRRKKQR